MDTALIAALIGAVATIIAALVAEIIRLRVSASRDRELMVVVVEATSTNARRVLEAQDPKERAFLAENLELFGEVIAPTASSLKRAEITVHPEEQTLAFVVQQDNPRPAFNALLRLTNGGQRVGIVDGLESILTGPERARFRFVWNLFYTIERGGLLHKMSSYVLPIPIPPGGSLLIGIQFIGPDLGIANLYSWPTGKYEVEMTGWVNRSPDRQPTNFSSKFYIDISSEDIARLKACIRWDDAAWARFPHPDSPDPDKAAGQPVRIIPG